MPDKNSYESAKSDFNNLLTAVVWIVLAIVLLIILPSWFTGTLWRLVSGVFRMVGWVCDRVGPYLPVLAVVWVLGIVVLIVWGLLRSR